MQQSCRELTGGCILSQRQVLAGVSFVKLSETPRREKHYRIVIPVAVLPSEPQAAGAGLATV